MGRTKEILLASLLGGVGGGTNQYLTEGNRQREYALKKLEALKPPSEIESLRYVEPGFDSLPERDKRQRLVDYKTAGAGVKVTINDGGGTNKAPLTGPQPTTTQEFKNASKREEDRRRKGLPSDPTDAAIVNKYKGKPGMSW